MKKNLQALLAFTVLLAISSKSDAQTLIDYWSFNTFTSVEYTDTIHGISADYSDLNTAAAQILYAEMPGTSSSYITYEDFYATLPADSDVYNLQFSDTAGNALRLRNPSDSMYLLFYIPTTNFANITITYAAEASSATHGMLLQTFSYSLDSGATWITSGGLSIQSDSIYTAFRPVSITFTDTNANNNPKLVFRAAFGLNNTGISGNDRIDNVTVTGDTITATTPPSSVNNVAAIAASYTLYPNPVSNALNINSVTYGLKAITIYNTAGQNVYSGSASGKTFSVNVASLAAGSYFIHITDNTTGKASSIKFVKQ